MILEGVDLVKLSKLTSQHVDNVTCLECCKYYIAPETAACGHTLCHSCWRGRRSCPTCAVPLERKSLKFNLPLQSLTEHVHQLGEAFEKVFDIKLDEFILDTPDNGESENDPTKNVKEWLASSQNHFSAPIVSEQCSQETLQGVYNPLDVSSSKIQIHVETKKDVSPKKVVHVSLPQDDWDKIETMPETEAVVPEKENIVGPMDIEPYFIEDNEYTVEHPRRSSRKRDLKDNDNMPKPEDIPFEKPSPKDSNEETDKKSNKSKQNWGNVKRMRKEFSKLNKINRNKLNVSIEMCKKTQSNMNKPTIASLANEQPIHIDENTPNVLSSENNIIPEPIDNNKTDDVNMTKGNTGKIDVEDKQRNEDLQNNTKPDGHPQVADVGTQSNNNIADMDQVCGNKNSGEPCDKVEHIHIAKRSMKMPFIKKSALCTNHDRKEGSQMKQFNETMSPDSENIEITIKVGNTVTNILIKKKEKDVNFKINTDKEIQTSLGSHHISVNSKKSTKDVDVQTVNINIDEIVNKAIHPSGNNHAANFVEKQVGPLLEKSASIKKHTASADTATAQFEITDSVEKELSKIMECKETEKSQCIEPPSSNVKQCTLKQVADTNNDNMSLNDFDIFESESLKGSNVHFLKNSKHTPSEILVPTVRTMKTKSQKNPDKRDREEDDEENVMPSKKIKTIPENNSKEKQQTTSAIEKKTEVVEPESENYDAIMSQVFANIDADIKHIHRTQNTKMNAEPDKVILNEVLESVHGIGVSRPLDTIHDSTMKEGTNEKYSENVFSICEKEKEKTNMTADLKGVGPTQQEVLELLTPGLVGNLEATHEGILHDEEVRDKNTPFNEYDDSDKSVVEDTPQKNLSFSKLKQKNNASKPQSVSANEKRPATDKIMSDTQYIKSIINLTDTDTLVEAKSNVTVLEIVANKKTMETPLTINKFVDDIKHKSTPVARKSLNFDKHNIDDDDPEQTLCPTVDVVAKNTQEKEFMYKAFENSPSPAIASPLSRNISGKNVKKYCIAGSCLSSAEIAKLKYLCFEHKWTYVDKYTTELTHLVVGVDEENKAQRSVKYMCALAAGKWIVSFDWIEKCLKTKTVITEETFEALDSTGEPGPRRSRLANNSDRKLFEGITFYCMPPFSVLDVDTLKGMVEAAGGAVASQASGVRVTVASGPALLLAEPEHTQEDRFMYLAMELGIVPVNYEWVLNCLGSYTLGSVQELLLCPAALLPAATAKWPAQILAREYD